MTGIRNIDLDGALLDPAANFEGPDAVVENEILPLEYKVEILRRWAYDAIEMAVAEEEGMGGGEDVTIDVILAALHRLTGNHHSGYAGPTKHATA